MTDYVMPPLTDYPDFYWAVDYTGNEVVVTLFDEDGHTVVTQARRHHSEYEGSAAEAAVEVGRALLDRMEAVQKALKGLVLKGGD